MCGYVCTCVNKYCKHYTMLNNIDHRKEAPENIAIVEKYSLVIRGVVTLVNRDLDGH